MHKSIWWVAVAAIMLSGCDDGGSAPDNNPVMLGDALLDDDQDAEVDETVVDAEVDEEDAAADAAAVDAEVMLEDLSLNSLVPNRALVDGGAQVRVIGSGFAEGLVIAIGGTPCIELEIVSPNQARCTVPAGPVGSVPVVAVHERPDGEQRVVLEEGFSYYEPVEISAIQPDRIPLRGNIEVLVRGRGLIDGSRVTIGGERAANVVANDDGTLSVIAPPGMPGPADVEVINFNGQGQLPAGVFYYEDLALDRLDPPVGPLDGGLPAIMTGSGLTRDSLVLFGDNGAEIQGASEARDRLDLTVPRGQAAGAVDITIENDNGSLTVPDAFVYYDPAAAGFTVAGIAPASGPVEGGNAVFVAGSGFDGATTMTFDGRDVPCELLDANRLSCTAPPGDVGPVDVEISRAGETIALPSAYTYFQTLEIITIDPDRGAVAGGTVVTLTGTGFVEGMEVQLGEVALVDVDIIDETTLVGQTAPSSAGPVDVRANTEFSRSVIPSGFTYFDPTADFGGVWGDQIEGSVNVTVLNAGSGQPEAEAAVILFADDGDLVLEGLSNGQGQLTLSDPDLEGPVNVTAAKEGFEATTIEDVEAENVTILLQPNDGEGSPPPGVPAAVLRGVVTGLDVLPKPVNEIFVNIVVVETTHTTPYNRDRLPPPGPGGLLLEDGPFEIIARPGELAIVATAGEIDRDILKDFQDGLIDYWTMRLSLSPISMGIRRFISPSPGDQLDGLDVEVDHRMDLIFPVDLDNPPAGAAPGPQFYAILPRLNFGAEGFWELDTQSIGIDPALTMRQMPRLEGWPGDISYYLIALAFSNTANNQPMSITIEETRDVDAGVFITPFVGSPFLISPLDGGALGADRRITWGVHDGFDGPIRPASANLVTIEEPQLGPPKPLWRYVTPSLVTDFEMPVLPAAAGEAGLGVGAMILTVVPFIAEGPFDFDNFTYNDLNRWRSWGVTSLMFTP